jgi:hypothetical protein
MESQLYLLLLALISYLLLQLKPEKSYQLLRGDVQVLFRMQNYLDTSLQEFQYLLEVSSYQ